MTAREATERAMEEVGGALIAIALVLTSVFVPVAFMTGIVGQLYQQFAITLAVSILLSALVALALSPALCAMLLRPRKQGRRNPVTWALDKFNVYFDRATNGYVSATGRFVRMWPAAIAGLIVIIALTAVMMQALPTGFVPTEDQGYYVVALTLPQGASLERTDAVLNQAENRVLKLAGVESVTAIGGDNMLTGAMQSNSATMFVRLKHWDERLNAGLPINAIVGRTAGSLSEIAEAMSIPFVPPPIPGLGTSGGFQLEIQDRGGSTIEELGAIANQFSAQAMTRPELSGVFNTFQTAVPQIRANIDRDKASTVGIPGDDAGRTAVPKRSERHQQHLCTNPRRADGPFEHAGEYREIYGSGHHPKVQLIPFSGGHRVRGGRVQLGTSAQCGRGNGAVAAAEQLWLYVGRCIVPGACGGRHTGCDFHAGVRFRVSIAGRSV
jgi:HAE1 family hydrophobic/amphiphilic exporter-1/multidrug efflux pump